MTTRIKFRRDTAANWTELNPTLALGEPGFEQDTNKLKIGDGETAWVDLDYTSSGTTTSLTDDHSVTVTVGNTEYFAIVNRANNNDDGVEASAVAYDSENNLITLHVSEVYNGTDNLDILIISKFDDTGALLWQKQIDQDVDQNTVHDLAVDADDNIIVAASVDRTGPDSIVLMKLTSSGSVTWQKNYVGSGQYSFIELGAIVLSGTDIFVTGDYVRDDDDGTDTLGFLMKVSATAGALDWATTFQVPGFSTNSWGMAVTTGGDPVIVGKSFSPGPQAAMVARYDGADGSETWTKTLFNDQEGIEYTGGDVTIDSQNNIFVSVNSYQDIVHEDGSSTTVTIAHVMKLNSSGVTQWIRRAGPGPCASVGTGIVCDSTGNVYMSALTVAQVDPIRDTNEWMSGTAKNILAVVKYSTAGAVLWQRYVETDNYELVDTRDSGTGDGNFDYSTNRGRYISLSASGKLAVQVTGKYIDSDDFYDNSRYYESITFQIDQDGREMTVGSGNEKFTVKASRIPGKFITIPASADSLDSGNIALTNLESNLTVTTATLTLSDGELAQQVAKSAPYEYVFGNDGTFTVPNDGDVRLTQTQLGWFSVFGRANNSNDDIWFRANCVDTDTGDVYAVGQDDDSGQAVAVRYNSAGEVLWSIRLYDDVYDASCRANAVKIHPTTGNVVVLVELYGPEDAVVLVQIDPDTARVVSTTGFQDLGEDSGALGYDLDFLGDGKIVVVGRKYDEYQRYSVTSNTTISTTGLLVFNRSDIPGKTIDTSWWVGGTDINTRVIVDTVNYYTGLTGTVRQGSGATFSVTANDGDPGVYTANVVSGGTNYLVGHRIKIPGTSLGGATPANDLILTVATVSGNAIATIDSLSGTADGGSLETYNPVSGTNYLTGSGFAFNLLGDTANIYTEHATSITNAGNNYVDGDTIVVPGTQLGGNTTTHDLTVTVSTSAGNVTTINSTAGNQQTTRWYVRTTAETPNFGNVSGAWTLQQTLGGEAFVFVGTAANVAFAPVWTRILSAGGQNDDERYFSVAVDASDNIYAAGEMIARNDVAGSDLNSYWCAVVTKFNSAGTHQWTKALNTSLADNYAKCVAVQGNVVVVSQYNAGVSRSVITKMDTTGTIKWQRETYSNDDSSVAIDTNGDVYAVIEATVESQYNNCIKVIKFNTYGEVVWRKILATHVGGNGQSLEDFFKNGRNLTLDADHLYVSGYTTAFDNNYENGFMVKIPKSGDCDGIYGGWTIINDAYDVDKINFTEATAFSPNGNTGEFETWEPDLFSNWFDPGNSNYQTFEEIRDRDGGAIEFADGTRQTSSAQQIPQKLIHNGADHRLSLEDMGKHIYVTNSDTRISVPYSNDVQLPIGFTVVIVNNSGDPISIDGDGGGVTIIVPGVDSGAYWDLASPGMATLIKVDSNDWFMTGHVTVD
jgi:hypothetical protein